MLPERPVRLFDLAEGEWTDLVIRRVGVHYDDGGFMVNRRIPCRAQATSIFEDVAGTRRRLFVHLEPPVEGVTEIWLEDAGLPGGHPVPRTESPARGE